MNSDPIPASIARYRVRSLLGEGAMGRVYLAEDPAIGRQVAIKTVRGDLQLSESKRRAYLERFSREARAAGRLSHPNIVAVFDVGETDRLPWIAMEFVEGVSFKEKRLGGWPANRENVLLLTEKVTSALDAAHSVGTIHRDIKPANILISSRGEIKVTDFGIAHLADSDLTNEGVMLGSPSYMSPEQVRGRDLAPASDLFSLAVILYEWITGVKPFDGGDLAAITHKIVYERHARLSSHVPTLPREVDVFFDRALSKRPDDRFVSGAAMYEALRQAYIGAGEGVAALSDEGPKDATLTQMRRTYVPDSTLIATPAAGSDPPRVTSANDTRTKSRTDPSEPAAQTVAALRPPRVAGVIQQTHGQGRLTARAGRPRRAERSGAAAPTLPWFVWVGLALMFAAALGWAVLR